VIEHKQIVENERAVLVGLVHRYQTETQLQEYLHELAFLAETAGAVTAVSYTHLTLPTNVP
jgi:GTP-binding protein HflX